MSEEKSDRPVRTRGKTGLDRQKEKLKVLKGAASAYDKILFDQGIQPYGSGTNGDLVAWTREEHASRALTIHGTEPEGLVRAFKKAELDPENPWHWRALLESFADSLFPSKKVNARWTANDYMRLLANEQEIKAKKPKITKAEVIRLLTKSLNESRKKDLTEKHVKRMLKFAKDRKKNSFLEYVFQDMRSGMQHGIENLKAAKLPHGYLKHLGPREGHAVLMAVVRWKSQFRPK